MRGTEPSVGVITTILRREHDRLGDATRRPPAPVLARPAISRQRSTCARASRRASRRAHAPGRAGPTARSRRRRRRRRSRARARAARRPALELAAQRATRPARMRGPLVPAVAGAPARLEHARPARSTASQSPSHRSSSGSSECVIHAGFASESSAAPPRSRRARRGSGRCRRRSRGGRRLAHVGQRSGALEEAAAPRRARRAPGQLPADVRRHARQERPPAAVGDLEGALERVEALGQPPATIVCQP